MLCAGVNFEIFGDGNKMNYEQAIIVILGGLARGGGRGEGGPNKRYGAEWNSALGFDIR